MHMVIPHVLRAKFTSQRFLNQISALPVPHWIQNSADFDIYMYMLAFCCGGPTLRTSQMLTYIIATLTVSTSLPLSTELQEVYFIPRPRNKALAAVKIQNYIYICILFNFLIYLHVYKFHAIFIELYKRTYENDYSDGQSPRTSMFPNCPISHFRTAVWWVSLHT